MGKTLNRPFFDKYGTIGRARVIAHTSSPTPDAKKDRRIQYEIDPESKYLYINVPIHTPQRVKVSKRNAIKLAHWLLERCSGAD